MAKAKTPVISNGNLTSAQNDGLKRIDYKLKNLEKYKKAEILFEKFIYHSEYQNSVRIRNEAEKYFNEMSKLENKMSKLD